MQTRKHARARKKKNKMQDSGKNRRSEKAEAIEMAIRKWFTEA